MKSKLHLCNISILTGLFMFFIYASAHAQGITSISLSPQNPTTQDIIVLTANTWFPSGPCQLDSINVDKVGQNFYIHAWYTSGMLAYICNSTDSTTLGYIESGTFTLHFYLHYATSYTPSDSSIVTFIVSPMVSVDQINKSDLISVFPNPVNDALNIDIKGHKKYNKIRIELFSSSGNRLKSYYLSDREGIYQLRTTFFKNGLYLIRVFDDESLIGTTRFNVIR